MVTPPHPHLSNARYVTDASEIESRNARDAARAAAKKSAAGSDDSGSDDDGSIDLGSDDGIAFDRGEAAAPPAAPSAAEVAAAELLASEEGQKKYKPKTANPNDVKPKNIKLKDMAAAMASSDPEAGMTRKERDDIEAKKKKEAYDKKHAAGLTDEYKKDMEWLAMLKKKREEAEAAKKADAEEEARVAAAMARAKIRAQAAVVDDKDDGKVAKLEARVVKAMNPKDLKDALKERGLSTQGSKKDLLSRLLEAAT